MRIWFTLQTYLGFGYDINYRNLITSRESMDVSESEKEELSGEGTSEVKNKLLFDNTPGNL